MARASSRFDLSIFERALGGAPPFPAGGSARAARLGATLVAFDRVGSTQDVARALLLRGAPDGTVVLAEEQWSGRGRRGRSWASPAGGGIWATVILRRALPQDLPQWLTLAGALALCESARHFGAARAEIKWPNDLIAGEKKLAGVLGELVGEGATPSVALLGIGLNVDLDPRALSGIPGIPGDGITSLRAEGLPPGAGREIVLASILGRLEEAVGWIALGSTGPLLERWRSLSPSSMDRRVSIEESGTGATLRGTTRGIAADGSLIVESEAGETRSIRFGGTVRLEPIA